MAESINKPKNFTNIVIGGVAVALIIAGIVGAVNANRDTKNIDSQTNAEQNDDKYLDAMKKCTVMEGADIYTTGVGGNRSTAFDDAQKTCVNWYKQWGEDDFYEAVYEDWENRKTEVIEGKDLNYYLEILGW